MLHRFSLLYHYFDLVFEKVSVSLATRLTQWPLRNMGMDHVRSLRGGGLLYRSCKEKFTGYSESSDQKYEVKHCV